jgi:hypothetical protein
MATHHSKEVPVIASEAVLIRSEPMPEGTPTVKGNKQLRNRKKNIPNLQSKPVPYC